MIKASIVIPVYNVEKYLEKCVRSVSQQTMREIEIILIDDGSKDSSGKLCDQLAAEDARITVIHKDNQGVSAARNDGLNIAKGEWITFCDSDDWMEPDFCESMIGYGEKTGADVVIGDVRIVEDDSRRNVQLFNQEFIASSKMEKDALINTVLCKFYCPYPTDIGVKEGLFGGPWNKMVKRQLLTDNEIKFDVRVRGLYDDLLYTAHIYASSSKISYLKHVVYNYRQVAGSITHKYNKNIVEINECIFDSWNEFFKKYEMNDEYQNAYRMNVLRRFKGALNAYFFHEKNEFSVKKRISGVKDLLKKEPYCSAFKEVDAEKMPISYKVFVRVLKIFGSNAAPILYYMRGNI